MLAGSPSAALTSTIGRAPSAATARIFGAAGKPAAAAPAQTGEFDLLDQPRRSSRSRPAKSAARRAAPGARAGSTRHARRCRASSRGRAGSDLRCPARRRLALIGASVLRLRSYDQERGRCARAARPFRAERPAGQPQQQARSRTPPIPAIAAPRPAGARARHPIERARVPPPARPVQTRHSEHQQPALSDIAARSEQCSSAIGQQAYASQCVRRQPACPMRWRRTLVTITASSRLKATAPSPSHRGR